MTTTAARVEGRAPAIGGVLAAGAGVVAIVVGGPGASATFVAAAVIVGLSGFVGLVAVLGRRPAALPLRAVLAAGVVLVAVAVAFPPAGSKDVASYALYGRMVTTYHENPYAHVPDEHRDDPWYPGVSTRWRQTPSVYGPAFTALSAGVTRLAGGHRTLIRLLFQATAGLALLGAGWAVARTTGDGAATAALALNPVLLASVVNGGHNDAIVGAALLGACLLARRRRWPWVGVLLALAAATKVAAVLAVPALAVWAWHRHGRRAGVVVAAVAGGLLLVAHLAWGPVAVTRALAEAGRQHSRSSVWRLAFGHGAGPDRFAGVAAIAASIALGAVLVWRRRRDHRPELVVASALAGYLLLGSYVLPWYHAWVLMPAAVVPRSRVAVGSAVASAVLLLGYTWPPGATGPAAAVLRETSYWGAPAAALGIAAWLVVRDRGEDDRAGSDPQPAAGSS